MSVETAKSDEFTQGTASREERLPAGCCLLARRCCYMPPLWCPEYVVFPSPRRTWTFSSIFHVGASPPPRFSPRNFHADRRTPACPRVDMNRASKTARLIKFSLVQRGDLRSRNNQFKSDAFFRSSLFVPRKNDVYSGGFKKRKTETTSRYTARSHRSASASALIVKFLSERKTVRD